jgi:hypothetical protein
MVHLEAKRLKLAGMPASEIPSLRLVLMQQLAPVHPAGGDGDAAADAVHALPGGVLGHHAEVACSWIPQAAGAAGPAA